MKKYRTQIAFSVSFLALTLISAVGLSLKPALASRTVLDVPRAAKHLSGFHMTSINVDGIERHYGIYLPKSIAHGALVPASSSLSNRLPVVILLHGASSSPSGVDFDSDMSSYADKENFIVVYPSGTPLGPSPMRFWNAGICCGPASNHGVDDVAFVRELLSHLKNEFPVDPARVYIAGVSNGAMMAYRLAVELSDQIAAIGSIDGCMFPPHKAAVDPVSVIEFHGTRDPVIPYDGGTGRWFFYKIKNVPPVAETVAYWVAHNNCHSRPIVTTDGDVVREAYTNGTNGSAVALVTTRGGKHVWPGGRSAFLAGHTSTHLMSTREMLDFFWAHPKQSLSLSKAQ
jgi:polyhydroxybutyrate depolymerase